MNWCGIYFFFGTVFGMAVMAFAWLVSKQELKLTEEEQEDETTRP